MKKAENNHLHTFRGAGYLLGGAVAMATAVTVFVLSENITVSISAAVPIGTTMGIVFEQQLQGGGERVSEQGRKVLLGLLVVGIIVFIALFFIAKLV